MAPASSSTVPRPAVGSSTAMAGRSTPGAQPSVATAVATVPPVEPADTRAPAWPLATSPQATAALVPGRPPIRTPLSPIGMTSAACTTSIPAGAPCSSSSGRSVPASPARTTRTPCWRTAATAPATCSRGAWSPPMASSTIGAPDPGIGPSSGVSVGCDVGPSGL